MELKYSLSLVFISCILTNTIAFLDEGIRTFDYLLHFGDWIALLIYTFLFLIVPFSIFFLVKKSVKTRFLRALFGFGPAVFLILVLLV